MKSPETVFGQSFDDDDRDKPSVDTGDVEDQVVAVVRGENLIPAALVESEVNWFFNELGIEPSYFLDTAPKKLAEHVLAIFGAKGQVCLRGVSWCSSDLRQYFEAFLFSFVLVCVFVCVSVWGAVA